MGTCFVDGCGKKTIARGLCWRHYARLRAHGDPLKGRRCAGKGEGKKWIEDNSSYDGDECLMRSQSGRLSLESDGHILIYPISSLNVAAIHGDLQAVLIADLD